MSPVVTVLDSACLEFCPGFMLFVTLFNLSLFILKEQIRYRWFKYTSLTCLIALFLVMSSVYFEILY